MSEAMPEKRRCHRRSIDAPGDDGLLGYCSPCWLFEGSVRGASVEDWVSSYATSHDMTLELRRRIHAALYRIEPDAALRNQRLLDVGATDQRFPQQVVSKYSTHTAMSEAAAIITRVSQFSNR